MKVLFNYIFFLCDDIFVLFLNNHDHEDYFVSLNMLSDSIKITVEDEVEVQSVLKMLRSNHYYSLYNIVVNCKHYLQTNIRNSDLLTKTMSGGQIYI